MYKKHFSKFQCREKGITLIEVIIATFILLVAIVGSYLVFTQIFMATFLASDRLVASYLGQEGIEVIRNIRDTNWISGVALNEKVATCSSGCQVDYKTGTPEDAQADLTPYNETPLNIDTNGFYTYEPGTPTKFKRKITITYGTGKLDVLVKVLWDARGQSYSFQAEEILYNWR